MQTNPSSEGFSEKSALDQCNAYILRHPTRKWRADFAHLESRTLIEIEGGIIMRAGGRHTRGTGYAKDAEKYLGAALEGWTIIRLTEKQLDLEFIERIVALLRQSYS